MVLVRPQLTENVYEKVISQFKSKDQGKKNETCYANAISACILITLYRFSDNYIIDEEEYNKLRDEIIIFTKKNMEHRDTFEILKRISDKYKFDLNIVDEIGARKAVMKTRICVVRFGLTKIQWKNFCYFYEINPKAILTKNILGERKKGEKLKGHSVILTQIFPDHLYFLNSYGKKWGDDGYFRVQNAEVLNAKFMEISIEPYNYTDEQKGKFEQVVNKVYATISQNLFDDDYSNLDNYED